jgi:hypothetical protein
VRRSILLAWILLPLVLISSDAFSQQLFSTAETRGFATPSVLVGFSFVRQDADQGEDFTLITARASIGIGRKTDIFGSFDGVLGSDVLNTKFLAWSAGIKHQFIRTHIVDLGGIARIRGNRTSESTFEDALLDFAGIISIDAAAFHPYYAIMFSRPYGLSLSDKFQRTNVFGAEVPIGDIPRVIGEFSVGDRRSFGLALELAF